MCVLKIKIFKLYELFFVTWSCYPNWLITCYLITLIVFQIRLYIISALQNVVPFFEVDRLNAIDRAGTLSNNFRYPQTCTFTVWVICWKKKSSLPLLAVKKVSPVAQLCWESVCGHNDGHTILIDWVKASVREFSARTILFYFSAICSIPFMRDGILPCTLIISICSKYSFESTMTVICDIIILLLGRL